MIFERGKASTFTRYGAGRALWLLFLRGFIMTRLLSLLPLYLLLCVGISGTGILSPAPVSAQVAAQEVVAQPTPGTAAGPTSQRQAWLSATPEQRVKIAEELGEEGARLMAKKQGWQPLVDGLSKSIPQGPDQIYSAADGTIHVVEAKGGSGQLGQAYGYPQGTPEWAVKSCERLLRSAKSSSGDREAAREVLEAASQKRLQVHVVRTSHVLGEPSFPVIEQTLGCTDEAARLAKAALGGARGQVPVPSFPSPAQRMANTALGGSLRQEAVVAEEAAAGGARAGSRALRTVTKGAIVVGVGVDAGLRLHEGLKIEERFRQGEFTQEEREPQCGGHGRRLGRRRGGRQARGVGRCGTRLGCFPRPGDRCGCGCRWHCGGSGGLHGRRESGRGGRRVGRPQGSCSGITVTDLVGRASDGSKDASAATG